MPSILGANSVSGYTISNSLRFNAADSPSLQKTFGSAGNQKTMTFSFWVKRSIVGDDFAGGGLVSCGTADGDEWNWTFRSNVFDLRWETTNGNQGDIRTTAKFRDLSAWYHMVLRLDTTDGTAANRIRWYVNGTLQTDHDEAAYPNQNLDFKINGTVAMELGRFIRSDKSLVGYLADFYFVDGTSYGPDTFAETNDEGVWIPKDAKSDVTFGTNGYFLEFQQTGTSANSSGIGADTSGNDNHFTLTNLAATDVTTDTPQNNFCTLNPLDNYYANATFSEGNCKMVAPGTGYGYPKSTIGVSSGKWYFEAKASDLNGNLFVGIASTTGTGTEQELGYSANDYGYKFASGGAGSIRTAGSENAYGNAISTSDILGVAFDLDNNKLYFSKNGTYQNSGDPAAGSNGFSITAASSTVSGFYSPSASEINSSNSSAVELNFGNPSFSISSGNNDGKYGNFEYAPPSGFYALCTKRLADFG